MDFPKCTPVTYPKPPTNSLWKKNLSFCGFVDAWRMLQGYVGVPLANREHFHIAFQAACVVVFLTAVANHGEGKHHANVHHLLPFGLQGLPGSASTIFQPLPSHPSSKTKSSGLHRHQLGSIEIGRVVNASCERPSFQNLLGKWWGFMGCLKVGNKVLQWTFLSLKVS